MTAADARILHLSEAGGLVRLEPDLDRIFFEASNTKAFADAADRAGFRERWLGRYLRLDPAEAFVALDSGDRCIGYLVGCLTDPAQTPRFNDVGYFHQLADLTRHYPAHLHINLAPEARSLGIGGRLIAAFAAHAHATGTPGIHVVTSKGARNERFYLRNSYSELRVFSWNDRDLVMLGRRLLSD